MRKNRDTRILAGNDPGRPLRTRKIVAGQIRVVGADANTDDERTEDVEKQDTPEYTTDCLGDVLARVGCFTCSDCHHLDTTVGEGSVDERGPEASKTSSISSADVLLHSTLFPVTETSTVLIWGTSEPDDDTAEEETQDGDDLDRCETELGLAINGYGEDVQADDDDDDDGDPDTLVDLFFGIPEANDDSCSRYFSAESNGTLIP